MKNKIISILIGILIMLTFYYIINIWPDNIIGTNSTDSNVSKTDSGTYNKAYNPEGLYNPNNTNIEKKDFNIAWNYMEPMIKNSTDINYDLNYYNDGKNPIKAWDVVVYENPFTLKKLVLKVTAIKWDKVDINKDKWTVNINWSVLKNSSWATYIFTENELKQFEIYSTTWIIKDEVYFLLTDNINSKMDSRSFWPSVREWILWKVIIPNK